MRRRYLGTSVRTLSCKVEGCAPGKDVGIPGRHFAERPGQTDPMCVTQGMKLPLTKGVLRVAMPMEQPRDVGVESWALRGQAGLGSCAATESLGH